MCRARGSARGLRAPLQGRPRHGALHGGNGCPSYASQAMSPRPVLRVAGWSSARAGPYALCGVGGELGTQWGQGQRSDGMWRVACPAQAACDGLLVECRHENRKLTGGAVHLPERGWGGPGAGACGGPRPTPTGRVVMVAGAALMTAKRHLPSHAKGDLERKCSGPILNHPFNQLRRHGRGPRRPGLLMKGQVTAGQADGARCPSLRGRLAAPRERMCRPRSFSRNELAWSRVRGRARP